MNTRKCVFIAGYYGFGNLGDEAVLEAMLADLRCVAPQCEYVVASESPAGIAAAYGVHSILWRDSEAVLNAVDECDVVLLGGGGILSVSGQYDPALLLTEGHNDFSCFKFSLPIMAYLMDKPFMIYAAGAHIGTPKAALRHLVLATEIADMITIRDSSSKIILDEFGCNVSKAAVTADAAFSLAPVANERVRAILKREGIPRRHPIVLAALRSNSGREEQWEQEMAHGLGKFAQARKAFVLFVPFSKNVNSSENNDLAVIERVRAFIPSSVESVVLQENLRPSEVAGIVASCDLVIGMRYHSLVMAINGHVPYVSLVYDYNDPKMLDLTYESKLTPFQLDLLSLSSQKLLRALEQAYLERGRIWNYLRKIQPKLAQKARLNAQRAVKLLERPSWRRNCSPRIHRFFEALLLQKVKLLIQEQKQLKAFIKVIRTLVDKQEPATALSLLENLPRDRWFYHDPAWNYLVAFLLHTQQRDLVTALHCYDLALQRGFSEFWIRYNRGALYIELGDRDRACQDLRRAIELDPRHEGTQKLLQRLEGGTQS